MVGMPAKEEYMLKERVIFITDTISIFKPTLPNSKYNCYWFFITTKNNITISDGALLWTRPLFSAVEQVIPFTVCTLPMRMPRLGKRKKLRGQNEHVCKVRNGCRKPQPMPVYYLSSVNHQALPLWVPISALRDPGVFPKWTPERPLEGHGTEFTGRGGPISSSMLNFPMSL